MNDKSKDEQKMHVMLINPPVTSVYKGVSVNQGVPYSPMLNLAVIAAAIKQTGNTVRILDANLFEKPFEVIRKTVRQFLPDWIGITVVTPLWNEVLKTISVIRETNKRTKIVLGGPHISAMPVESIENSNADVIIFGEGDFTFRDLIESSSLSNIPGAAIRLENDKILVGPARPLLQDLDSLPMPAWDLYDIDRYNTTALLSKRSPAGWIETSRGCPFGCVYCSKHTFGHKFRVKTPKRVVDEMAYMLKIGFREIHIADDCFSFDIDRAKRICEEILRRNLKFPWAPVAGIRVDYIDDELLHLMRLAGCYRLYFGIESGSDAILKRIKKGISVEKIRQAVRASKRAGLETFGFFMIALPGETEKTMKMTLRFARELDLDMAKMTITIPLVATPLYNQLKKEGRLYSTKWSDYNMYRSARTVYRHENLDWDTVDKYYRQFYRTFYFRPHYVFKRLLYALRHGTFLTDFNALIHTKW